MLFPLDEVENLEAEVVQCAATRGYDLRREAADRTNTPTDFRFLQLLLTVAGDPEVHLGAVRVPIGGFLHAVVSSNAYPREVRTKPPR